MPGDVTMSITIGSNIPALKALKKLTETTNGLASVYERLSSGMRINRASDDAAGLSIATSLEADARIYNQAIKNVNDGLSLLNVADSAVSELSNILTRIKELAEQSANGVYSDVQREALDKEAQALRSEYNRVISTTQFNGISLFADTGRVYQIQAGTGTNSILSFELSGLSERYIADGTFSSPISGLGSQEPTGVATGDFNGDGFLDLLTDARGANHNISIGLGRGDGTFFSSTVISAPSSLVNVDDIVVADFNNDGNLDFTAVDTNSATSQMVVYIGNGDGSFQAQQVYATGNRPAEIDVADYNNDGFLDIATANSTGNSFSIFLNDGDGTFTSLGQTATLTTNADIVSGDFNGDNIPDLLVSSTFNPRVQVFTGDSSGGFTNTSTIDTVSTPSQMVVSDFDGDGNQDFAVGAGSSVKIYSGNGNGTFTESQQLSAGASVDTLQLTDLNDDGTGDLIIGMSGAQRIQVRFGYSDGSFSSGINTSTGTSVNDFTLGDFDGDGFTDVAIGTTLNTVTLGYGQGTSTSGLQAFSLATAADARTALSIVTEALTSAANVRSGIGASQSRLSVALSNLRSSRENYKAAAARIIDADIALESASLVRLQILQQVAASVLSQAKVQPSIALTLLRSDN